MEIELRFGWWRLFQIMHNAQQLVTPQVGANDPFTEASEDKHKHTRKLKERNRTNRELTTVTNEAIATCACHTLTAS